MIDDLLSGALEENDAMNLSSMTTTPLQPQ